MANDHLIFRKRTIHERRAIRFIRGETISFGCIRPEESKGDPATDEDALARYRHAHFGCLRQFSRRNGLEIRPVEAPYIAPGEWALLRWLAEAQRQVGLHSCDIHDLGLTTSIRTCAAILTTLGVRLPIAALRTASISCDRSQMINPVVHGQTDQIANSPGHTRFRGYSPTLFENRA